MRKIIFEKKGTSFENAMKTELKPEIEKILAFNRPILILGGITVVLFAFLFAGHISSLTNEPISIAIAVGGSAIILFAAYKLVKFCTVLPIGSASFFDNLTITETDDGYETKSINSKAGIKLEGFIPNLKYPFFKNRTYFLFFQKGGKNDIIKIIGNALHYGLNRQIKQSSLIILKHSDAEELYKIISARPEAKQYSTLNEFSKFNFKFESEISIYLAKKTEELNYFN